MTGTTNRRRWAAIGWSPSRSDDDRDDAGLLARRRRPDLPTGRAIAGGLLVAIAALGIVAAHRAATTTHDTAWLVVRRPVAAGARLRADDLALAPMGLRNGPEGRAVRDPDDAVGRVALVPLAPGDLVMRSAIARAAVGDGPARRVGVALQSAQALGGEIAVGDRVDVVAVPDGHGSEPDTPTDSGSPATGPDGADVIAANALVTSVQRSDDRVGSNGGLAVVLTVDDVAAAQRIVAAEASGGVTLLGGSALPIRSER